MTGGHSSYAHLEVMKKITHYPEIQEARRIIRLISGQSGETIDIIVSHRKSMRDSENLRDPKNFRSLSGNLDGTHNNRD